ncbi:hypothetical protein TDB9533_02863 [Thalassocella blandensis]|nr:hypothetical protein TDB9533_02863 [Thalassocella blandensis]
MITYHWETEKLLRICYSDIVSGDELIQSALEIAGDARFDYAQYVLGDWSKYTKTEISQEDVRTLIAIMKSVTQICPNVKNATVIRPDETGNALVAFYKMLGDVLPWQIEIYHTFDDAFAWFGIERPAHLPAER